MITQFRHGLMAPALLALTILNSQLSTLHAQGTAFSYNGQLSVNGSPANGSYDVAFTLFATNATGVAIAGPVTNSATGVTNGLFAAVIDFGGGVFTGSNYWLQLAVRTNGSGSFTNLSPRQPILPTPYAIYSTSAGSATTATTAATAGSANSVSAANIAGTIQLAQLPGTILTNNESGVNLTGGFTGNGSGLTNISLGAVGPPGTFNLTTQSIGLAGKVTVGNGPRRVVVADFNGDGTMDLATANETDGTVSVLTNNGNGNFTTATTIIADTPNKTVSVVAGDFNGDGKMDLAVANSTDNNVIIFTNAGNATFAPMFTNVFGYYPYYLMAGDFNGDGKTDYAATMIGAPFFAVEFNRGNTNFYSTGLISANYSQFGVAVDVNGDGYLDVITANYSDKTLTVNTNNGQGVFYQSSSPVLASGPSSIGVGDFYGTGKPALAVSCSGNSNVFLLSNQGGGIFVSNAAINLGATVAFVTAADMNGDGKPDLICAVGGTSLVILTNDWHGNFAPFATLAMPNSGNAISITVADVNGDGFPDVIFSDITNNMVSIFTNSSPARLALGGVLAGNGYGLTNLNVNFSQLSGTISPSQLARGVLTNNETGVTLTNVTVGGSLNLPAAINFGGLAQLNANANSDLFMSSGTINPNSGYDNTAFGISALSLNYGGGGNTAIGAFALFDNSDGYANTAIGEAALYSNTYGNDNTAIGTAALYYNTNGYFNTASGYYALFNNTSGSNNIAIGYAAGNNITNGSGNIDIGSSGSIDESNVIRLGSGQSQTYIAGVINGNGGGLTNLNAANLSGTITLAQLPGAVMTNNAAGINLAGAFTGNGGGLTNLNASQLASIGNVNGSYNLFIGTSSGNSSTSGNNNTAVGDNALVFNTSGSANTAIGGNALNINASGTFNTAIGSQALAANTGGYYNIALGYQSGMNITNSGNIDIGNTGVATDTNIIRIGTSQTQTYIAGTINGAFSGNGGGLTNLNASQLTSIGNVNGSYNLFLGTSSGNSSTSGNNNTAVGDNALVFNTSGSANTAIGGNALNINASGTFNTAIGSQALAANTGGYYNIALGYQSGMNITNNGNIDIGNTGVAADTNIIRIGTSQTATYIAGVLLPPPPVLIQTNFIDGQRYTNSYGWPLTIGATIVLSSASVAGSANESFCIQASPAVGGFTNVCAISTIVGNSALHYTNHIYGFVPTNAIYWFTNLSTGAGNSASVNGGQLKYP